MLFSKLDFLNRANCAGVRTARFSVSVTRKKSSNVYKCCPKMILLEKLQILTPLQKLPKNLERIGEINCAQRLYKVAQISINRPIWSHWISVIRILTILTSFQAILELNTTELSHSLDHVGAEVFAEPYSFVCLMGTKLGESSQQEDSSFRENNDNDQFEVRRKTISARHDPVNKILAYI